MFTAPESLMAITRLGRRPQSTTTQRQRQQGLWRFRFPRGFTSRRSFRLLLISLAVVAILPPVFFHFKLKRFHQIQLRRCGWLNNPPLVCAHGGDSNRAFPNTLAAYLTALHSQVDCIEIDVSRSSDGVLFALHDSLSCQWEVVFPYTIPDDVPKLLCQLQVPAKKLEHIIRCFVSNLTNKNIDGLFSDFEDLQQISGNSTSKVGYMSAKEIKELVAPHQLQIKFEDLKVPTIEDALKIVSSSVRHVVLDAKVGPPLYERDLAKDILSVVERAQCKNCIVWAKSDHLVRDVMTLSPDTMVGYIVMIEHSSGVRSNLLRMRNADVVGIYHPLVDEKVMKRLHGRNKKVYAWTVDDVDSMKRMLDENVDAVVTSNPSLLQRLMQDTRTQCLEEGFSFSQ